jgi:F-type H+-transporting ATPase subunit delta
MVTGSVARRYAKALFGLAVESGRVQQWSDALEAVGQVLASTPELVDALGNPAYGREQRRSLVELLATTLNLDPEPTNLILLLGDRNRLDELASVVQAFTALADANLGRVRARVTSAAPLDAAALEAIAARLSRSTQGQVILERAVDPALMGGVVAQVGNLVYDGSVRTQLEDLRNTLKR